MNKNFFYAVLLSIAALAVVAAVVVFPFYKPLSLMYYFNQEYQKSLERYQALYEANDRSISVMGPLIWLNLQYANVNEAIRLMEEYIADNSTSVESWKYLGDLYLGADRPHSYLSTLEERYKLAPSANILREELKYYSLYGYDEKSIEAYRDLIQSYRADTWECAALAYLYAEKGLYEEALAYSKKGLEIDSSKQAERYVASMYVSLLLNMNKRDEALAFSVEFIKKNQDMGVTADLAALFRDKYPEDMMILATSLPEEEQNNPLVIQLKASSLYAQGKGDALYTYLKELLEEGKLPKDQLQNLVDLGLEKEDDPRKFEALIQGQNLNALSDSIFLVLLRKSYKERLSILREKLKREIPKSQFERDPILKYAFEITEEEGFTPNHLSFYLLPKVSDLSPEEQMELALIYDDVGLASLSRDVLEQIEDYEEVPYSQLSSLAELLNRYRLAKKGWVRINRLKSSLLIVPPEVEFAYLLLALGSNQPKIVLQFLEEPHFRLNDQQWLALYYTAMDQKEEEIALVTSSSLLERHPNSFHERLYAEALLINGEVEKGVEILKKLYLADPTSKTVRLAYLNGLVLAVKGNRNYLEELNALLDQELQAPTISKKDFRYLAYSLADAGLKEEAIRIFFVVASDLPFDHEDTKALLYLFGEEPKPAQIDWIVRRTVQEEGEEKGKWLEYLKELDELEIAYSLIYPRDLRNRKMVYIYAEIVARLRKEEELQAVMDDILAFEEDVEIIRKLNRIIHEEGLYSVSERGYLRILCSLPQDKEALKELGAIYFTRGAFRYAKWYISSYLCLYEGDYLLYYYMGEMYHRDSRYEEASLYYLAALGKMEEREKKDLPMRMVRAQVYHRLNYSLVAIRIYENLVEEFPFEKSLRADFGNLLIDLNCLCYAAEILFNIPEKPPKKDKKKRRFDDFSETDLAYLDSVRALWFQNNNQIEEAYEEILGNVGKYSKSGSLEATLATLENHVGRWRAAIDDYEQAREKVPDNEEYYRAEKDIIDAHRPYAFLEGEYRKTGATQKEHFFRFEATYNLELHSQVGLFVEQDDIHVTDFANVQNGVSEERHSLRRRGELRWLYHYYDGFETLSQIFFSKHVLGLGAHLKKWDLYGFSQAGIEYHRPNWDYAQTVIEYGSRNRIYAERFQRFCPRLEGRLLIASDQYAMGHLRKRAADSISWQGGLVYQLPKLNSVVRTLGKDSSLYFSYLVDAEYPTWVARRKDLIGNCFNPLPIDKQEIHTFEFELYKSICRYLRLQGRIGYAYNRFGGINRMDPVYGASLHWDKRPGLTLFLLYDHSPSTAVTGQDVDRFLMRLNYVY